MILLGSTIKAEVEAGNICISPFDEKQLGPNSYDVRLSETLLVYTNDLLDARKENPACRKLIPDGGYILTPGELYLGSTVETATSKKYVPMFEGRSSVGRLGISTHQTAAFGDVGFAYDENGECTYASWTLELSVIKPVRIYPNMRIGQVFFVTPDHVPQLSELYRGKYNNQKLPQASMMFKDFELMDGPNQG